MIQPCWRVQKRRFFLRGFVAPCANSVGQDWSEVFVGGGVIMSALCSARMNLRMLLVSLFAWWAVPILGWAHPLSYFDEPIGAYVRDKRSDPKTLLGCGQALEITMTHRRSGRPCTGISWGVGYSHQAARIGQVPLPLRAPRDSA